MIEKYKNNIILKCLVGSHCYGISHEKSDKDYRLILVNGIEIITDTLVSTDKYDKTYRLYSQRLKDNQEVHYMDIRFKDINVK